MNSIFITIFWAFVEKCKNRIRIEGRWNRWTSIFIGRWFIETHHEVRRSSPLSQFKHHSFHPHQHKRAQKNKSQGEYQKTIKIRLWKIRGQEGNSAVIRQFVLTIIWPVDALGSASSGPRPLFSRFGNLEADIHRNVLSRSGRFSVCSSFF